MLMGVAVAAAGVVVEAGAAVVSFVVAGVEQPQWLDLAAPVGRLLLWVACWMLWFTAVSALIRNRVGPVLVLCLVPLLGERVVGMLLRKVPGVDLSGVGEWLPFTLGRSMMVDMSAMATEERNFFRLFLGTDVPAGPAAAGFVAYTAVVAVAGFVVYRRRSG
ncbi:hypothetical protein RB199_30405 [Streptomyces libani]